MKPARVMAIADAGLMGDHLRTIAGPAVCCGLRAPRLEIIGALRIDRHHPQHQSGFKRLRMHSASQPRCRLLSNLNNAVANEVFKRLDIPEAASGRSAGRRFYGSPIRSAAAREVWEP